MKPLATLTLAMLCMLPADAAPATLPPLPPLYRQMPGTLEPPTPAEKAACTARIRREYEKISQILPTITDRQSANDAALALLSLNKLVNLAWEAEPVSDELIAELMKPKEATAEDRAEINRLKAADFYGSHLLMMSLGL